MNAEDFLAEKITDSLIKNLSKIPASNDGMSFAMQILFAMEAHKNIVTVRE